MQAQQNGSALPTTRDLYERLKSLSGKETAYAVAKHYGWNAGTVRRWEKGHSTLDEFHVDQVADALGLDRGYVALCMSVERTADAKLAAQMRAWLLSHGTAAALLLAVFTVSAALPASAVAAEIAKSACILC